MNRKTKKVIGALGVSLGMFGLGYGIQQVGKQFAEKIERRDFVKESTYEGYPVRIGVDGRARGIAFMINEHAGLSAKDYNHDGRFDVIHLESLPNGHPLEKFANTIELERVYSSILQQK